MLGWLKSILSNQVLSVSVDCPDVSDIEDNFPTWPTSELQFQSRFEPEKQVVTDTCLVVARWLDINLLTQTHTKNLVEDWAWKVLETNAQSDALASLAGQNDYAYDEISRALKEAFSELGVPFDFSTNEGQRLQAYGLLMRHLDGRDVYFGDLSAFASYDDEQQFPDFCVLQDAGWWAGYGHVRERWPHASRETFPSLVAGVFDAFIAREQSYPNGPVHRIKAVVEGWQ